MSDDYGKVIRRCMGMAEIYVEAYLDEGLAESIFVAARAELAALLKIREAVEKLEMDGTKPEHWIELRAALAATKEDEI